MTTGSKQNSKYQAIVIGAGHNGLTTAAMLAKQGRRVLVLERHASGGGMAIGSEFHPGYTSVGMLHDTSTVSPKVVEELGLEQHGLVMSATPPAVFAPTVEGRGLLLHFDAEQADEELRAASPSDAARYAEYRSFFQRISPFVRRVLQAPPPDILDESLASRFKIAADGLALRRLGRTDMLELMRAATMSVSDWLSEWFESETLKCTLAGPALCGSFLGPRSPQSVANLIRGESLARRGVRGGPMSLIEALADKCRHVGVDIRTGSPVERIRVSSGQVAGVTLVGGEEMHAPSVAASCDPKQALLRLIAPADLSTKLEHDASHFRATGTMAKVNLALSAPLQFACRPDYKIEYARIADSLSAMEKAFDCVKYDTFSGEPLLDIYVPTASRPELAPRGHCVVSIRVSYAPHTPKGGWSDKLREQLGDAVVRVLSRYAPGVERAVVAREVLAPPDIELRYGTTRGHVHHGEHGLDQMLVRPTPHCARYGTPIAGLFLCGSGSHPGGGLTCLPGMLAAKAMLD